MKMKAFAAVLMTGMMAAAMTLTGFAAELTGRGPQGSQGRLPEFHYVDDAPYMDTILDYMVQTRGQWFESGDVMIPNFVIMRTDDSNPDDVKVWGNFWINNYDLQGDNLFCKNGGEAPGCVHLRRTPAGSGYTVTWADFVGDGSNNQPDSERIFGIDADLMRAYANQDLVTERSRTDTIRKYVFMNGLPINTYQDYGWEKVQLR